MQSGASVFPTLQLSCWRLCVHWGDIKGDERSWCNWPWLESAHIASNLSYFSYFTVWQAAHGGMNTHFDISRTEKKEGEERKGKEQGGEERRGDSLVSSTNSSLGEHWDPGHIPMLLESKDWTGGVGMVMERYNEMLPSGHVVSPACRMEQAPRSPQPPPLWVTGTATFLPEWIRVSGALGQGRNGAPDNRLRGCGWHFRATRGTQPGAKSECLEEKKNKPNNNVELGAKIVHHQRNKHISLWKTEFV